MSCVMSIGKQTSGEDLPDIPVDGDLFRLLEQDGGFGPGWYRYSGVFPDGDWIPVLLNGETTIGSALSSADVQAITGEMFDGNVEDGVFLTYNDVSGKIDTELDQDRVEDIVGALLSGNHSGLDVTYNSTTNAIGFTVTVTGGSTLTTEQVQDIVGNMVSDNSESNITVTYNDASGKLDFSASGGSGGGVTLPIAMNDVTGLNTALDDKADDNHTHSVYATTANLNNKLDEVGPNTTIEHDSGIKVSALGSNGNGIHAMSVKNTGTALYSHALSGYSQYGVGMLGGTSTSAVGEGALKGMLFSSPGYTGSESPVVYGLVAVQAAGGPFSFWGDGTVHAGGGFEPFTGSHVALTENILTVGDIVVAVDTYNLDVSNYVATVEASTAIKDKRVFGVVNKSKASSAGLLQMNNQLYNADRVRNEDHAEFIEAAEDMRSASINALGEGLINVCMANGSIDAGDYITTSGIKGKGQKQDEAYLANYTVAKAVESVNWNDAVDGVDGFFEYEGIMCKQIACTYHCG